MSCRLRRPGEGSHRRSIELREMLDRHGAPGTTLDERDLRAGPFAVRRVVWSAATALPPHAHAEARVIVALDGTFRETRGDVAREHSRGSVIVRPAGSTHSDAYSAAGGGYVRIAIPDRAVAASVVPGARAESRSAAASCLADEVLRPDPWSALAVQGLVYEIFAEIARASASSSPHVPPWIAEVRELLRDEHETMWTLADLGRRVGVEPAVLGRSFRRHVGVGVGEELRRARVFHARRLIEGTSKSLAEIASEVGFADQSHLTRATRRVLGATPGALRRRVGRHAIDTTER